MKTDQIHLLFLCTGNSCRSQIAEGWARELSGYWLQIQSAGIEAHGQNPLAIAIMQDAGVDISGQESSKVSAEMLEWSDYVVTVCGHADEHCPVLPPGTRKEHWPLSDPAKADGSQKEIMAAFLANRDDIKQRVVELVKHLQQGLAG